MKRQIRIADEEVGNILPTLLFSIVWYVLIFYQMKNNYKPTLIIFLVSGIMPLYTIIKQFQRAFFYRRQRKAAVLSADKRVGHITGIIKKRIPYTNRKGNIRYNTFYYLRVDVINPSGTIQEIESQPYSKPIHHYIGATAVNVYTDSSGFKYYIEDIQWKTNKNDPDIFQLPEEFDEKYQFPMGNIVFVLFILLLLLYGFMGGKV